MKLEQQEKAETLFFQTEMSKTDIAETVGVSRRTITQWVNENNWQRIRTSAEHMPSFIAENLYVSLAHLAENLIMETRMGKVITEGEGRTVQRLTQTINKLKNRGTLNENLEMLKYFMEFVNETSPEAIDTISPLVNKYISNRAKTHPSKFMSPKMNDLGYLPVKQEDNRELQLDIEEVMSTYETPPQAPETTAAPAPQTPTPTPPIAANENIHMANEIEQTITTFSTESNGNERATEITPSPFLERAGERSTPDRTTDSAAHVGADPRVCPAEITHEPQTLTHEPQTTNTTTQPEPTTPQRIPFQPTAPAMAYWEDFNNKKYHNLNRAARRKLFRDTVRTQKQQFKTAA